MLACRSFLSRSRVPLLPQLHAFHRRVNVLGGANCTVSASRGHVSDASDGDRRDDALPQRDGGHHRTLSPQQKQKQFLYLVLEDVKKGCSVHKLDVDADDRDGVVGRLPGPPVFRMQYPNLDNPDLYVAVLGSNIIAIGTGTDDRCGSDTFTEAFDLKTAALTVLHGEPTETHTHDYWYVHLAVAAGNMLFLFTGEGRVMECLELLQQEEEDIHGGPRWRWSCHPVPDMDGICAHRLLYPVTDGICTHALHPGGRAFFVSSLYVYNHADGHRAWATVTFSYDTERGEWTHHGDWKLPFHGQAHYDRHLAVWVGLHYHSQRRHDLDMDTDGYLCCCDVPPPAQGPLPHWKLSKEKLFVVDIERHIDAKLVPMGGRGNFCLVEIMTHEGVDRKGCLGDGDKCLLRLTTFRVKYGGDDSELTITARRPVGEYKMSRYTYMFEPQAFWM